MFLATDALDGTHGNCEACSTPLLVNTRKIAKLEMFCPNEDCEQFVKTFWVKRHV